MNSTISSCPDGAPFPQPYLPIDLSWWDSSTADSNGQQRMNTTCQELTRDFILTSGNEDEYNTYLFYCGCNVPNAESIDCPGICANGKVLDPLYHDEYISDIYGTCGDLALMAALYATDNFDDSYQGSCAGFTYFGEKVCGCAPTPPPPQQQKQEGKAQDESTQRCEICEDGSLMNPDNLNGDCLFLAGYAFAVSTDDPQCSLHRGNAGVYCGCNNPIASEGVCRICGDDVLLPYPTNTEISLLGTSELPQRCWELETSAEDNFNLPPCNVIRESVSDECCNPSPTCPDGTPFPHPDLPINLSWWSSGKNTDTIYCKTLTRDRISEIGNEEEYNVYLHYCGCTIEGSDCPGICHSAGETLKPLYHDVPVSQVYGTCGDLALMASWYAVDQHKDSFQQSCAGFLYFGSNVCGCDPVIEDGESCNICEDGTLANPDDMDGECLFYAGFAYAEPADSPYCEYYQGSAGVYCGCQNPVASQDICRLCGDNTLLPIASAKETSLFGTEENPSGCWQLEATPFVAKVSFGEQTCDELRSIVSEECCTIPSDFPSLAPTDAPSFIPTNTPTLAPITSGPITPAPVEHTPMTPATAPTTETSMPIKHTPMSPTAPTTETSMPLEHTPMSPEAVPTETLAPTIVTMPTSTTDNLSSSTSGSSSRLPYGLSSNVLLMVVSFVIVGRFSFL